MNEFYSDSMSEENFVNADNFVEYIEKHKESTGPCLEEFYEKLKDSCNDPLKIEGVEEITRNSPDDTRDYWVERCDYRIEFRCIDGYLIVTRISPLSGFEPRI